MNNFSLFLASASPRRKQLLNQIGATLICHPVNIDESIRPGEPFEDYCLRLAREKAEAGFKQQTTELPVLGADTIVVHDGQLLGKPKDEADAFAMLSSLSGSIHQVMSSVCVIADGEIESQLTINTVEFATISKHSIEKYIATGEPMDKAGAYAIQGYAAMWIKNIQGSYSSIMGLPLFETAQILKKLAIIAD